MANVSNLSSKKLPSPKIARELNNCNRRAKAQTEKGGKPKSYPIYKKRRTIEDNFGDAF